MSVGTDWQSLRDVGRKVVHALTAIIAVLVLCLPMFSQAAVGTILGGVFDSSGGAIAGAQVTIIDVARGTSRVLTTDGAGEYTAPSLLAGTYTVRAQAKGFQTVEHSNVLLEVARDVRVDLTLQPGEQTQTVTVTAEVPAIDTTNSTLGGTITNQSITALPLITRNFLNLMELRPGVLNISPGSAATTTVTNGRRQGSDVLVVEGVTQFDLATSNVLINGSQKGGGGTQFPLDAVQEFATTQNSPAEYGWRDGSAINLGVKSGTNAIHGSAYAFGRDASATDARSYSPTGAPTLSNLQVENPGATVGGRIIKDKLFWFVGVEFVRQSSISTNPVTIPTDTLNSGGSGVSMVDACNTVGRANVNPLSAQIAGLPAGSCTPLPGTGTFENLFPFNTTGSQVVYPFNPTETPSNNGLAKVDYSPNNHNHFSGFVYISRQTQFMVGNLQPGGLDSPYWGSTGPGSLSEYAGSWTYTPNSTWVNDLRGGASPNSGNSVNGDINRIAGNPYGPTGYGVNTGVTNPLYGGFPCLNIGAFSQMGDCGKNGIRGPQYQLDFSDKVSYLHGNHALKFGYEEVFVHFDDGSTQNGVGTLTFTDLPSFLTGTFGANGTIVSGDQTDHYRERWHAAFVQDTWRISKTVTLNAGLRWEYIGSPHSTVNHLGTFDPTAVGGVVQVGPGLPTSTLVHPQKDNFNPRGGVAWDIFGNGRTVLRAGAGNLSSFPGILAVTGANVPYGATMCNGPSSVTATGALTCTNPANIVLNNYGKAIQGFIAPALSIPAADLTWNTTGPIFPIGSGSTATSGPTCGLAAPAPPCSMIVSDPNLKNPRSLQWNLDVQRALTNNLTLDVAYVGTHGYNEIHSVDLNEPAVGTGWDPGVNGTGAAGCLPALQALLAVESASQAIMTGGPKGTAFASKCTADSLAITNARPYATKFPYFQNISQSQNGFHSNYNGLQVTLDGRNYHGLNFLAAYTYSHALDEWTKNSQATSALADPNNVNYQYGNSDNDLRHRFRLSPTYMIPGKKSPGQMLEGWQISTIWAYQTGFAWAPNDQKNDDWGGTGESNNTIPSPNNGVWQSWNYTGPKGAFSGNGANPIPCYGRASGCTTFDKAPTAIVQTCLTAAQAPYGNPTQQQLAILALTSSRGACYIQNGGVLTPPAYGTLGNAGRGLFSGPRYQNWDFSLEKIWHFKERYSSQLRIECYNCFNHVNFAQFSDGSSDPSVGGNVVGATGFGYHNAAQGAQNGGSSLRQIQLGLKFMF